MNNKANEKELVPAQKILTKVKMFKGVPSDDLKRVIEILGGNEKFYEAKDIVWKQLEKCNKIGIVLEGCVQIEDLSRDEPQIIGRFKAGETFGEAISFGKQLSWVSVRAAQDSRILLISADEVLKHKDDPSVMQIIVNLLGEFSTKLSVLIFKNQLLSEPRVRNKMLMYLSTLQSDNEGYKTVPFLQKDLAQYLNVNRSAFNREIARMKDEGILIVDGNRVKVTSEKERMENLNTGNLANSK